MKSLVYFFIFVLLLCSCEPGFDNKPRELNLGIVPKPVESNNGKVQNRFEIQIYSTFADDLAYGHKRGIYLITDNQTGKKYIGVSGIGISELGNHQDGENTNSDER